MPPSGMKQQGVELIVLLSLLCAGRAHVTSVIVVSSRRMVVHKYLRVVHHPPAAAANRPRNFKVVAHLRPLSSQGGDKGTHRGDT
jgi:hypothetical protein